MLLNVANTMIKKLNSCRSSITGLTSVPRVRWIEPYMVDSRIPDRLVHGIRKTTVFHLNRVPFILVIKYWA